MSQADMAQMSMGKYCFCLSDTNPPVQNVEAIEYGSVASNPRDLIT